MLCKAFSLILLMLELLVITTYAFRRSCRNNLLSLDSIRLDFEQTHSTKVLADGNITRYLTINWKLHGADATAFDGYLIRVRNPSTIRTSLPPFRDPDASRTKLWIRSKNLAECYDLDETKDIDNPKTSSKEYCGCNKLSCPFLNRLNCISSDYFLRHRFGAFYAIPNTRTSITYETKYRTPYSIEFYPYYQQYITRGAMRLTVVPTWSCAHDLSDIFGISEAEANRKCCEKDLAAFSPLDVRRSDFVSDSKTSSLNFSLSWVPPVNTGLSESVVRIYSESQVKPFDAPQYTAIEFEGTYNENSPCETHNRTESMTIYNLQPNTSYTISIIALHYSKAGRTACRFGGCTKSIKITTNLCHSDNSKCSDNAYCEYNTTALTANCECKPGFTGNGVSTDNMNGTGCEPMASSPSPIPQQTTNEDASKCVKTEIDEDEHFTNFVLSKLHAMDEETKCETKLFIRQYLFNNVRNNNE